MATGNAAGLQAQWPQGHGERYHQVSTRYPTVNYFCFNYPLQNGGTYGFFNITRVGVTLPVNSFQGTGLDRLENH